MCLVRPAAGCTLERVGQLIQSAASCGSRRDEDHCHGREGEPGRAAPSRAAHAPQPCGERDCGPHHVEDVDLQEAARRLEAAEHERLQAEQKRYRKSCQPRSSARCAARPGAAPRRICDAAESGIATLARKRKSGAAIPASRISRPNHGRARSDAMVQESNVWASIMTSTVMPRSQSRYPSR